MILVAGTGNKFGASRRRRTGWTAVEEQVQRSLRLSQSLANYLVAKDGVNRRTTNKTRDCETVTIKRRRQISQIAVGVEIALSK